MKKFILALSLFFSFTFAGEYETSIGLGHQQGGVIGVPLVYKNPLTKYYASLGVIAVSVGFQTTFSENSNHAYGIVIGREELQSEYGFLFVTYDYQFKGFTHNGFVIGTGLGMTRKDERSWYSDYGKTKTSPSVTLNIGYKV